jgi:hypothetical protein
VLRASVATVLVFAAAPLDAQSRSVPPVGRWVDFQTLTLSLRARAIHDQIDQTETKQLQQRTQIRARFKFDREAKYAIHFGVFTGTSFPSGWNSTGIGDGSGVATHSLKQFFLAATPVDGVEVQLGSVYLFSIGESTDITTYDEDGYVTAGRVSIKRREDLYFDDVTVSIGSLGDDETVSIFDRQYESVNYYQFQASRRLSPRLAASFDLTRVDGDNYWRPSVLVGAQESRVVDRIRLETYYRDGNEAEFGFALSGEKQLIRRLQLEFGYADIDIHYPDRNSDRFYQGKRLFVELAFPVTSSLNVRFFTGHEVGDNPPLQIGRRTELVAVYNFLPLVRKTGWFPP